MNLAISRAPQDVQDLAKEWPLVFLFDLPPASTIVVVGAYKGRLIALLNYVYPDAFVIHGFEPQHEAIKEAHERFDLSKTIVLHNYGLKVPTDPARMRLSHVGTVNASLIDADRLGETFEFCDAAPVLESIPRIDLLVMNIEGYEAKLLPYLRHSRTLEHIDRLAVQFHPSIHVVDGPEYIAMDRHHKKVVNQYPQWVYWVKRDA